MNRTIIFISLILSIIVLTLSCKKTAPEKTSVEENVEDTRKYAYGICIDSLTVEEYPILNGDNLSSIFMRMGMSASRADSVWRAATSAGVLDPTRLRAGMQYIVLSSSDSIQQPEYVVFAKSRVDYAVIDLRGDSIKAYGFTKPVTLRSEYTQGLITSSLWNTIKNQGGDPLLALHLSDVYAWQIDFFDVKEGDSFKVMYDVSYIDDTISLGISSINGAIFTHQGKDYYAIPFTQDSISEFFDEKGESLRRAFLKAPMDFFRITSRFSNSRFHPVLKRYRAHHGVDYAAPTGTPVKTIGDGIVETRAYQAGGAGNYLKIKHNSSYTTSYMHLSRFAKGIKAGSRVKQGEVIGYVGSTGLSTGPHLDFRVYKNGAPIDPLKMESPPSLPIRAELMDSFNIVKQQIMNRLNSLSANYSKPIEPDGLN